MSTILPLAAILLLSLWLCLRAHARRQARARDAVMFAQLEEMESSLNRLDCESVITDRELRKFDRSLNPSPRKPKPPRKQPQALSTQTQITENQTQESSDTQILTSDSETAVLSASPRDTSAPKRPRALKKRPQTLEEYEASRKPLPPSDYNPNSRAAQLFDQLYKGLQPANTPTEITGNRSPFALENPRRPKQNLLAICLAPLRLALRCFNVALQPVLLLRTFAASFFTRPKPPPHTEALPQNRAA